jgi:hypothetical protein
MCCCGCITPLAAGACPREPVGACCRSHGDLTGAALRVLSNAMGIKRPEREADYSSPWNASTAPLSLDVSTETSLCLSWLYSPLSGPWPLYAVGRARWKGINPKRGRTLHTGQHKEEHAGVERD